MAVELMMNCRATTFASESEETAAAEAASGLQSVEKLIQLFSSQHQKNLSADGQPIADYAAVADAAVSKFKNVISLLDRTRTGHARFRRGPVRSTASPSSSSSSPNSVLPAGAHSTEARIYCPTPIQQMPLPEYLHKHKDINPGESKTISFSYSPVVSRANSFMSSLTSGGDAEAPSGFQVIRNVSCNSAGKPPLSTSSSFKRKCTSSENAASGKCSSSSGRCQCSKRRKVRVKREIRVPAISMKMSDIPPDDYSWRKYGQKPIKGSPHPRGYYKCSSVRGCPARKHVERAVEDPTMLVVTYEGDHNHALAVETPTALILESS